MGPTAYRPQFWNPLIAVDQWRNAYSGGDPDESISSRATKNMHVRGWHMLGNALESIDRGHIGATREEDTAGAKFPQSP